MILKDTKGGADGFMILIIPRVLLECVLLRTNTFRIMKASFSELTKADTPVLVDFYADWCAPCKMLAPVLKQLKDQLGDRLKIIKVDVDRNNKLAGKYQVRGVPTLVLFKQGKAVWRQSGVMPKEALLQAIQPHL